MGGQAGLGQDLSVVMQRPYGCPLVLSAGVDKQRRMNRGPCDHHALLIRSPVMIVRLRDPEGDFHWVGPNPPRRHRAVSFLELVGPPTMAKVTPVASSLNRNTL